ncbi:MAG: WecB/TagA/CpsF family glycosyltransferase [Candidatus Cloacimonetes bacterium]|jgi:N-acetylglucosaminyldiphosphoundecaprenol N-acetyl-beta-D-mannosaminyltransferase|nr:WecB/TagA/CpsF family glycosyltransferase [Candidatus Cloacimonadota bacterium]
MQFVNLFGFDIANVTMHEACELTIEYATNTDKYYAIFTPNANMIVKAMKDETLFKALVKADLLLPDGISLLIASKRIGNSLKEKVSGSSYFEKSCSVLAETGARIFLLGASEGIGETAAKELKKKNSSIKIVGTYSPPYRFEENKIENDKVLEILNKQEIDVLYVAMSGGRGEKWIMKNKEKYKIPCSIQIGAAFDFVAGKRKIPPEFIKKIGFAWLWRLLTDTKYVWRRFFKEDIKILKYILLLKKDGSI